MDYSNERTNKDKDTFQSIHVGSIVKSSMQYGRNRKKGMRLAALEIQFGFNRKQDNAQKTKQLKLNF